MRIISFIIRSFLIIGAVAIVSGLLAREALLLWAMSQVQTDVQVVRTAMKEGNPNQQCRRQGSSIIEGEQLATGQLRFTSPTTYALEIVCNQYQRSPMTLKNATLPPFVQLVPGSSGITLGKDVTGVTLSVFGRHSTVYMQDSFIKTGSVDLAVGSGPATACTGYGYTCCQSESETGVGQQIGTATDCPRTCFTSCRKRPVLLSLTADPFIDSHTRTVTLEGQQTLTVNYTIQQGAVGQITARFDFGDGTVEQSTQTQGSFTHTYQCLANSCQFTAHLAIEDGLGDTAAEEPYNSFTVQMVH